MAQGSDHADQGQAGREDPVARIENPAGKDERHRTGAFRALPVLVQRGVSGMKRPLLVFTPLRAGTTMSIWSVRWMEVRPWSS